MEDQKEAVRDVLDTHLFVRATDLLTKVVAASKGNGGQIFWITLQREFHSTSVKTVLAIASKLGVTYPIGLLTEALFTFFSFHSQ